jgi:hypothetical protein
LSPAPATEPPPATLHLNTAAVELLAARIAKLLAQHLTPQPSASCAPGRLLSAAEVSAWWGVSRGWVYQHASELGALRIGEGERPRLRFDPDRVAERLKRPPASPPPTAPQPRHRVRRSPRIRGDTQRLAFDADPELSSLHSKKRWPGDAPTSPAAAAKTTASTR